MSHSIRADKANSPCGESNGQQVLMSVSEAPIGHAQNYWSDLGPFSQLIIEATVMLAIGWGLIAYYSAKSNSMLGSSRSSEVIDRETISVEAKN